MGWGPLSVMTLLVRHILCADPLWLRQQCKKGNPGNGSKDYEKVLLCSKSLPVEGFGLLQRTIVEENELGNRKYAMLMRRY